MVKNLFHILNLFFCVHLMNSLVVAQSNLQFYVDVSPKAGSKDESYIFSVVIENARDAGDPQLTGGDDFNITFLGPKSSTLINNGVVSTQIAFNYRLQPKKEGLLETPGAEVEIDGQKHSATPLKVKVLPSSSTADSQADQGVFIKQTFDRQEAYLGEQVVYYLSLYVNTTIFEPTLSDTPFTGFWSESLGEPEKSRANYNNQNYNVVRWSNALYAVSTGNLTIEPRVLNAKIRSKRTRRGFPFGDIDPFDIDSPFFGSQQFQETKLTSNPLEIKIKPLPPAPNNFPTWNNSQIIVGSTTLEATLSGESIIKTGESKTLTLEVESRGNIGQLESLPLKATSDYKIYQEASQEKKTLVGGMLVLKKIFKVSIVPTKPGKIELGELRLGYFDPLTESYQIAKSEAIAFQVEGEDLRTDQPETSSDTKSLSLQSQTAPQAPPDSQEVPTFNYQEENWLQKLSNSISLSLSLMILSTVALICFAGLLIFRIRKDAVPRENKIQSLYSSKDLASLNERFRSILSNYCTGGSRLLFGEELRAALNRKIADKDLSFAVQNILDEFDSMQYSGKTGIHTDFTVLKEKTISLSRDILSR